MIFADFAVNSQPIVMKFYKHYFLAKARLPENFIEKYCIIFLQGGRDMNGK